MEKGTVETTERSLLEKKLKSRDELKTNLEKEFSERTEKYEQMLESESTKDER